MIDAQIYLNWLRAKSKESLWDSRTWKWWWINCSLERGQRNL